MQLVEVLVKKMLVGWLVTVGRLVIVVLKMLG